MIRFAITAAIAVSVTAWAATADEAYAEAKEAYTKLKGDAKRRALRHHWLNVAKKFEAVASKHPKTERAPEALFNAAQMANELSRISQLDEDREAAKRHYRKLIDGWPKHRLSDDAALALAKLLADREGDPMGARKVLAAAVGSAGDMKKSMEAMLAALPSPPKVAAPPRPQVAAAPRREAEPPRARPAREEPAEPRAPSRDVAEAIRRAVSQAPAEEETGAETATAAEAAVEARRAERPAAREETPAPVAQGRRLPPLRPAVDEADEAPETDGDEVLEAGEAPGLASLAEKLRDVRVGAREPGEDDPETRSRFKKLARDEAAAEVTLAQQLGLKVRRVVIDAGHGGHDTGAIGAKGTREKDVALAISKKLARKLEAAGLEVVLTRDDDTFVKLEDRTRFANRKKGDLFISIHCNAAPSKSMRGIETYTLNTSSNRYSIRLAARENATTERGVGDLQYILADLATKANTTESTHLADRVQRSLVRNLGAKHKNVKDLGTKEALFFVLLGAKMPAILVETSFLSHPEEEQRLASDEYQEQIAGSIAEAVDGFLEARNKVAQVD
jgi:N-acetylmuramoyl-L-alanine amidase